MKEVFAIKKWTKEWNTWYYLGTSGEFNALVGDADNFNTYAEAHGHIATGGRGIYQIEKFFIKL